MVHSTFLHVVTTIPQVGGCKYFLEGEIMHQKKTFAYVRQFARTIFSNGDVQRKKQAQEKGSNN